MQANDSNVDVPMVGSGPEGPRGFRNNPENHATAHPDSLPHAAQTTPVKPTLQKLDTSLSLSSGSSKLQHGLVTPIGSDDNELSPRAWSMGFRHGSDLDEPFEEATLPPSAFNVLPTDATAIAQWLGPENADAPDFPNMEDFDPSPTATPTQDQILPPTSATTTTNNNSSSRRSRGGQRRQRRTASSNMSTAANTTGEASAAVDGEPTDKRTRFLERNRVAAAKCRAKKKEKTGVLEARVRALGTHKDTLAALTSSLREELLYLRGEVLKHANCGDTAIDAHVREEVGNITGAKQKQRQKQQQQRRQQQQKQKQQQKDDDSRRESNASLAASASGFLDANDDDDDDDDNRYSTPSNNTNVDTAMDDGITTGAEDHGHAGLADGVDGIDGVPSNEGRPATPPKNKKLVGRGGAAHAKAGHYPSPARDNVTARPPRLRRELCQLETEPDTTIAATGPTAFFPSEAGVTGGGGVGAGAGGDLRDAEFDQVMADGDFERLLLDQMGEDPCF